MLNQTMIERPLIPPSDNRPTADYVNALMGDILPSLPLAIRQRVIARARGRAGGKASPSKKRYLSILESTAISAVTPEWCKMSGHAASLHDYLSTIRGKVHEDDQVAIQGCIDIIGQHTSVDASDVSADVSIAKGGSEGAGDTVGDMDSDTESSTIIPYVLSDEAVAKGWMPRHGVSDLSMDVRRRIPKKYRYWRVKDGGKARGLRDELVTNYDMVTLVKGDGVVDGIVSDDAAANAVIPNIPNNIPNAATKRQSRSSQRVDLKHSLGGGSGSSLNQELMHARLQVPIVKADSSKRIVYCVVLEPDEFDAQDDIIAKEEIERALHFYMAKFRRVGLDHKIVLKNSFPVEAYIAPQDIVYEWGGVRTHVKKGSCVMGIYVGEDAVWEAVASGRLTGLSITGRALRVPV